MPHRPKKRFGQNFLRDSSVIDKVLAAAQLSESDRILEIGPGLGVLTNRLLGVAEAVEVIEIDRDLIASLRQRPEKNLQIHEGDALALDWREILDRPPYKLVANLPYNISSQVLFKVLEHRDLFSRLVLMFQKEVGDRLCAAPGSRDYGILSVFCQLWYDIRRVTIVRPGAFFPPPKVDSVVLAFTPLHTPRAAVADEAAFRRVVKAAFAQRRKTLRNCLAAGDFEAEVIDCALAVLDIDPRRRGETLSIVEFAALAAELEK